MPTNTTTDLLVIGGGPGGLSAALTFARTLRPLVLYDSGAYRNGLSRTSHTIPGSDGADPAEWRAAVCADVQKYSNADVRAGRVVRLERVGDGICADDGDGFEAEDADGNVVRARKVVLATGVRDHLPNIPGLADQWGRRAMHCIFCHGTETAGGPMGFLVTRSNPPASNAAIVKSFLTLWASLGHTRKYIFTHGMDPGVPESLEASGLKAYMPVIIARGLLTDRFEIVPHVIERVTASPTGLTIRFSSRTPIEIPYLMVLPERISPSADAAPLLTPALLGVAEMEHWGAIPGIAPGAPPAHVPPRAGADPRTVVPGMFWAGNSGSPMANMSMSTAQGAICALAVADEIATEDLDRALHGTQRSGRRPSRTCKSPA